jgi:predicted metalloprotease
VLGSIPGGGARLVEDCRIVGVVNSVQRFWTDEMGRQNRAYRPAKTRIFTGSTQTGCGRATSDVGPFYCPADKLVYRFVRTCVR